MKLIDGKAIASTIRAEIKERALMYESRKGKKAGLAVILVGNNGASEIYVRNKIKACEDAGIRSFSYKLPETASEKEIVGLIGDLVSDDAVQGILVQLPLPNGLNEERILAAIPPEKDVDGFSAENIGRLALRKKGGAVACTPLGIMELLHRTGVQPAGKRAVVIGRSNIVGRPMALLLLNDDATVTVCHSKTKNLKEICLQADILISAVGKANFVTADMVKEGAVVIDVGMNRDADGKLCGDVDFGQVKDKASLITPVPGGVGPMTIAMLLKNTMDAAEKEE